MNSAENLRHLLCLFLAIKRRQAPLLFFYAASNRLCRATGICLCAEATLDFTFGSFRLLANRGDLGTIGEIFIQEPYRTFQEFIPCDGDTCIDVGANIGCVSLQWRLTNRNGLIIAVEPHPVTFSRMTTNFSLNRVKEIYSIPVAIGSTDGQVDIIIDEGKNSMARVVGDQPRFNNPFSRYATEAVHCLTLDSLVRERDIARVNLLKIDVEGFEAQCLQGAAKTLDITDRVVLEYHSEELGQACETILSSRGFESERCNTLLFARKRVR